MNEKEKNVETVIQKNVDCYNNRDIEGFMQSFSEEIELYTYREPTPAIIGLTNMRSFYKKLFDASPKLHSTIIQRIVFDNKVIDYEKISGRMGVDDPLELLVIYEVENNKIFRMTAIRK